VRNVQPDMRQSVAAFVARVHKKVNDVSQTYLTNERRYNYTTPKSFLEQIKLYKVVKVFACTAKFSVEKIYYFFVLSICI